MIPENSRDMSFKVEEIEAMNKALLNKFEEAK